MKRSTDRILTTLAGSLPRPDDLTRMMWDIIDKKPVDEAKLDARVKDAVADAVRKQLDAGIDIVSDGEMSKIGFSNYVCSGFLDSPTRPVHGDRYRRFPGLVERVFNNEGGHHLVMPNVEGPITLKDPTAVQKDIANFKAALVGRSPDDAFIPAVTPGQMRFNFPNRYYPSDEAYLEAAGEALRANTPRSSQAGFNLQLDSPDLCMRGHSFSDGKGTVDLKKWVPMAIEALNHATRGLPSEKIRLHLCWGNYPGPHHHDVELKRLSSPCSRPPPASSISRPQIPVTSTSGKYGSR